MSGASLTPQQLAAAHLAAGDARVLAGAGSGKTTVLTERFRFLADACGVAPRRIAALTFTDASAAEMRERIAGAFAQAEDPRVRARARDVEFAPISTIHAFGARLLREHAIAAGVDPAFVLLDATEARLLLEETWAALDRRLRRARDPALAVLPWLGEQDAWSGLLDLHERLRQFGRDPGHLRLRRPVALADARADLRRALEDLQAEVASGRLTTEAARAYRETFAALPGPDAFSPADMDAAARALEIAGRTKNRVVALPSSYRAPRDALISAYETLGRALLDEVAADVIGGPVRALLEALGAAYAQAKAAAGVLDFTDLERLTLGLLERLEAQGRPLEGRPEHVLVDEFQDVNPLQARILERLRRPRTGRRADLFAVGDPKQAIYRFRRADVGIMLRLGEEVGPQGRLALTESFRSRPELVAFHNALFSRLFSAATAGVAYEPLVARGGFFHLDQRFPPEVLAVDATSYDGPHPDAEARAVARRLRALVEEGAPRTKHEKDAAGRPTTAPRPLRWGDLAVLVRTNGQVKPFERALLAAGIPFRVGRGRGFYDTVEIEDLVHLLRVVHDPRDDFAFAAFLTSPAVGGTDEDLLACFGRGRVPCEEAAARPSLAPALAHLDALRRLAVEGSLEQVVRGAFDRFDLVPVALLQPGGARRARNLEKALAIARRLDEAGGHGLLDFLRRLEGLRDRRIAEGEASAGGPDDAVDLLTVHAAKGLEWPVVVVAGLQRKQGGGRTPSFVLDGEGDVGWRLRDPVEGVTFSSGGYADLRTQDRHEEGQEDLRLEYVALTRAQERLLMTFSYGRTNKDGTPTALAGWASTLASLLGGDWRPGSNLLPLGDAAVRWTVETAAEDGESVRKDAPWIARHGPEGILDGSAPAADPGDVRDVAERAAAPLAPPHRTPYVVTISDLLAFARDPAAYYVERVVGAPDRGASAAGRLGGPTEREDPGHDAEEGPDVEVEAAVRAERWDEGREVLDGLDRAALGRAVHRVIERLVPDAATRAGRVPEDLLDEVLREEFEAPLPTAAVEAARGMVARFLGSGVGAACLEGLARGREVRREAAFHARIRFPAGPPVAGFDSLLVKGTIDLWVGGEDGRVRLYDHKTNSPHGRWRDADALASYYALQLRLYALAAERIVGREVASASLLLLDPAWGSLGAPVEVPVDVGGEALEAARGVCRAYAHFFS